MADVALLWGGPIAYDFGPRHPLQPVRVELAVELMRSYGLLDLPRVTVLPGHVATQAELELIHSPTYITAVQRASRVGDPLAALPEVGLGPGDNPIFPGMHEAAAAIAGASIDAAEFVMAGLPRRGFSIAGGLHHAMRSRASGFCIYNDASIAIGHLRRHHGARVLYLDTDAHHGDGVQAAFYDSADVLTISFHESGQFLFPGTGSASETGSGEGAGYAINVPLPPRTDDAAFIAAFDVVVPAAARAFKPDVIVNQNGVDAHRHDPLAHLDLSTAAYTHILHSVDALAAELCGGRWLALGGGGYDLFDAVPRVWTLVFAQLLGVDLPDALPAAWREFAALQGARQPPASLRDAAS